jgi:hypothetical protein
MDTLTYRCDRSKEVEKKLKDVEKLAKDMAAKAYINPVNIMGLDFSLILHINYAYFPVAGNRCSA